MQWRILYRDGSVFSNEDGLPEDAPGGGVVLIAQEDDNVGIQLHEGQVGIFVYDEDLYGGWYNLDHYGFAQYLIRPGKKIVKLGEVIPTKEYLEILHKFREDPGFPTKSARYVWERKING